MKYKPPIRGKYLKRNTSEPTGRDFAESIGGVAELIFELKELQNDVVETVDTKLEEVDIKLQTHIDTIVDSTAILKHTEDEVLSHIKTVLIGPPGKDADETNIIKRVISALPEPLDPAQLTKDILSKVPKLDKKSLIREVIETIPQNKASLKVIQEKFEVDPMSVIEKIMALPDGEFKLKTSNIDGLEQTMSAFRSQLGRGYLHGGGDTVVAGTNVTITTNAQGQKVINASGGSGSGTVTSVSVVTANGVSGSVADATTTPAITLTLGAITPTSVNSVVISGSSTPTLAVTGTSAVSGTNTGDQTITLTGDVTGSGIGSFATTIKTNVALAGNPTTTTQTAGDNSTRIATTAFVTAAVNGAVASITGTANQVIASSPTGAITLSLPQSIATSSTPQFAKIGIGAAADANRLLLVTGDVSGGVATINRSNSSTNAALGTMIIKATSSGDMTDGFGAAFQFAIQDTAAVENLIADIRGIRNGADNTGKLVFGIANAGSPAAEIELTATALSPSTSDGSALGTTSLMWSDLILASGGVINWNNGDVLITHSSNLLAFTGAASGYTFDAAVKYSGLLVANLAPEGSSPPATLFATLDTRPGGSTPAENWSVLDYDDSTIEYMDWKIKMPDNYNSGGITMVINWLATSATTGNVVWAAAVRRIQVGTTDLDTSLSYDYNQASATACSGTNGVTSQTTITFTNGSDMDSWAAGEYANIRVRRVASDGGDTMTGDAELLGVSIKET